MSKEEGENPNMKRSERRRSKENREEERERVL